VAGESAQGRISNPIIGGRKGSEFFAAYRRAIDERLAARRAEGTCTAGWGEYGFRLAHRLFTARPDMAAYIAPFGMLLTLDAARPRDLFDPATRLEEAVSPIALALSVFNNSTGAAIRTAPAGELTGSGSAFARAYAHAMGTRRSDFFCVTSAEQIRQLNRVTSVRTQHADLERLWTQIRRLRRQGAGRAPSGSPAGG
jgi:hypothetical protein